MGPADRAQRSEHGPAGQAATQTPATSNTGVSSSQIKITGGLDWLDVGCYGHWERELFGRLKIQLEVCRSAAELENEGEEAEGSMFELTPGDWLKVRPSGAKRGCYYRYVCESMHGITFYVRDREEYDERTASVYVQIGSLALMLYGHRQAWSIALDHLAKMGFKMKFNLVSRVDLCADLPGVETHSLVEKIVAGQCIRRAKQDQFFRDGYDYTGYVCGKEIRMRIYNKLLEVMNNPVKLAVMKDRRWGGEIPEHATRVEFQLRRDMLKERWNIQTVDNLFDKLWCIIMDLCFAWFRMTEEVITREDRKHKNHQRYEMSNIWREIAEGFLSWMSKPKEPEEPRQVPKPDAKKDLASAIGSLARFAVLTRTPVRNIDDAWKLFKRLWADQGQKLVDTASRKKVELGFQVPSELLKTEVLFVT